MKNKYIIVLLLLVYFSGAMIYSCDSGTENESRYNPPGDHTISKEGAMHKPGLNDPLSNCSSCHGQDLRGGSTEVSCFECHGKKW
ncbi:MAG: hypothetical protein Kow00108_23380 [Calditrichia bacterium]